MLQGTACVLGTAQSPLVFSDLLKKPPKNKTYFPKGTLVRLKIQNQVFFHLVTNKPLASKHLLRRSFEVFFGLKPVGLSIDRLV